MGLMDILQQYTDGAAARNPQAAHDDFVMRELDWCNAP